MHRVFVLVNFITLKVLGKFKDRSHIHFQSTLRFSGDCEYSTMGQNLNKNQSWKIFHNSNKQRKMFLQFINFSKAIAT